MAGTTIKKGTYGKSVNPALQVVPDSATALTSTDTLLYSMYVSNTTASTVTFLVVDGNGREIVPLVSLPSHSMLSAEWSDGIVAPGGLTWTAGGGGAVLDRFTASKGCQQQHRFLYHKYWVVVFYR